MRWTSCSAAGSAADGPVGRREARPGSASEGLFAGAVELRRQCARSSTHARRERQERSRLRADRLQAPGAKQGLLRGALPEVPQPRSHRPPALRLERFRRAALGERRHSSARPRWRQGAGRNAQAQVGLFLERDVRRLVVDGLVLDALGVLRVVRRLARVAVAASEPGAVRLV